MRWLANNINSTVEWTSGFASDQHDISAGYVKQVHDGVAFDNAVGNVAFHNGSAVAFGNSFVNFTQIAKSEPTLDVNGAISIAESMFDGKHNGIEPLLRYLVKEDKTVALVHAVQIQNEEDHVLAYVDAHSGEVLSVVDFVVHASYKVLPIQEQLVVQGLEVVKDPEDIIVSPNGWSDDGGTTGNNAEVSDGKTRTPTLGQKVNEQLTFDFTYDQQKEPSDPTNVDAARTNAFYLTNSFHDIMHRYGFSETKFNFQKSNFGNGGEEGDPVQMIVQDPSLLNDADFTAPPDGQPGVARIFLWDRNVNNRDGAMENSIPLHELTHGVTNRMTGGGTSSCLQSFEAAGMGEGWSDAVADWFTQSTAATRDTVTGQGVSGKPGGVRTFPYSVSAQVNPHKYSDMGQTTEIHELGEVWGNILHNVYADLVDTLGFSEDRLRDHTGTKGNVVYMNLIINALSIQPCNPNVLSARDAIIQADRLLYDGTNECTLRKSFAKKGLGSKATDIFQDDDSVPANCQ